MDLVQTTGYAPPADPTAVMGRRTVAFLIDFVIGMVIVFIAFASLAESQDMGSSLVAEDICERSNDSPGSDVCINLGATVILAEGDDLAAIGLVGLVYGVGALLLLPALTGGSLGKLMTGLRVVDKETFAPAGLGKHALRWILWVVDFQPFFCAIPLVGLITGLSSKGHRRVGDMAAGTFVIDKKQLDKPVAVSGVNSLATTAPPPPSFPAPTGPPTIPPPATVAPPTIAPAPDPAPDPAPSDPAPLV